MNWKTIFIKTGIPTTMLLGISQASIAQIRSGTPQWTTASGNLTLSIIDRWGRSCASGSAVASYQVRNGSHGLLYPADCEAGPDAARDNVGLYRFEDITGAERCEGSMRFESVTSEFSTVADTTWIIERPVLGFICTTAGETYNVRLLHTE